MLKSRQPGYLFAYICYRFWLHIITALAVICCYYSCFPNMVKKFKVLYSNLYIEFDNLIQIILKIKSSCLS